MAASLMLRFTSEAPSPGGGLGPLGRVAVLALGVAIGFGGGSAQIPDAVREIELVTDPMNARVRPYESIVVRIVAYGLATDQPDGPVRVALRRGPAALHLRDDSLGWLSKPFRFQGLPSRPIRERTQVGFEAPLFTMADRQSRLQDAVLFTASGKQGVAVLSATLEGVTASLNIRVDSDAPRLAQEERVTFGPEPRSMDPYRPLAEHYAPFIAQATWYEPRSDYITRFDMDGDWRGDNNWVNAPRGSTQAYVYYAVIETDTHWFLIYNFFHPRDYSDKCVVGACHENDNEGMILTVQRDGTSTGRPVAMETLAHNKVYSYRAAPGVTGNFHNLEGEVQFHDGSHPVVFVHAGGHGVYGPGRHSGYAFPEDRFLDGTGVTYVYKGLAERPRHPADRMVGYDLLPIYDHWWLLAHEGQGRQQGTFSSYYRYRPFGGRPTARYPLIAGAFRGRMHGEDMAKPFWGWHDHETRDQKVLATGQWALDPAYAVTRNLTIPGPVSLRYTFNPYLSDPGSGSAAQK